MLHALTSDAPRYRYRVGTDSKYIVKALQHMHESTQDWVINRGPANVPAAASPGDRAAVLSRYSGASWFSGAGVEAVAKLVLAAASVKGLVGIASAALLGGRRARL